MGGGRGGDYFYQEMQVSPCVENINLGFTQTFLEHSKLVCSQLSGNF
jgi:hypothetical protein